MTYRLEGGCSIQLSYQGILFNILRYRRLFLKKTVNFVHIATVRKDLIYIFITYKFFHAIFNSIFFTTLQLKFFLLIYNKSNQMDKLFWRSARAVDWSSLENCRTFIAYRGFESHLLLIKTG